MSPRVLFFSKSSRVLDKVESSSRLRLLTGGRFKVTKAYPLLFTSTKTKSFAAVAVADWYLVDIEVDVSEDFIALAVILLKGNIFFLLVFLNFERQQ